MAQRKKKRKKKGGTVLLGFILVALFAACIYIAYNAMTNASPYINKEPSSSPTAIQASTPAPTGSPIPSSSAASRSPARTSSPNPSAKADSTSTPNAKSDSDAFASYANDSYGFSCPYPEGFLEYSGEDSNAQLSLRSSDGGAYEHIFTSDSPAETPAMDMRDFLSAYPSAQIIENRAGNGYFYALIKYEGTYIYRYTSYSDGTAKGFEFGYGESLEDKYSEYPSIIRADFTLYE